MQNRAGLKKRFLALFIDYVLIIAWGILLFAVNMFIYYVGLNDIPVFDELGMNLISLTIIMPVFLYSTMMEAGKSHATLGKQKMKIEVAAIGSQTIKFRQVIIRNIIKFLPWQFAHMMIFRGFALNWEMPLFWMSMLIFADILPLIFLTIVVFRKDNRGIQDLTAKTVVVDSSLF